MTRIQDLQSKIKAVRAEARAEVARLTQELSVAQTEFKATAQAKKDAKAQAQANKLAAKVAKAKDQKAKLEAIISQALEARHVGVVSCIPGISLGNP